MTGRPPARGMRENPDLAQLKRQAKELLDAYRGRQPEAVAEVDFYQRRSTPETFALHDAQYVLARSYGFESWPKLKAAVDGVTTAKLREAVERGDVATARALLSRRPEIVDLGRGEMRALHMAVLRRDVEMTRVHDSTGNIFEDMGTRDADERLAKAELARVIRKALRERALTQYEAARVLGVKQPDVSDLMRGKLARFSRERLERFLNALDMDVRIQVGPRPSWKGHAGITVEVVGSF